MLQTPPRATVPPLESQVSCYTASRIFSLGGFLGFCCTLRSEFWVTYIDLFTGGDTISSGAPGPRVARGLAPGVPRSVAMKITGHKTESVYRRYAIVSESDLADAARKLEQRRV